ncbi:MAG: exodeoxyribonuclease VII large subunit [Candidatus Pacebacteria bacterium]|nr:exodeoxyribonuclease VII large subunit [Candidatus Paceibacterota bacterium]
MKEKSDSYIKEILSTRVFSVSAYLDILNTLLQACKTKVVGEVSEFKRAQSGHVYFSLKDKKDGSVLNCVIWNSLYNLCGVEMKEGLEVIVSGEPDIYKPRGEIKFKVSSVRLVGEGELKKQYDKLKRKLEHLFVEEKKRPIPEFPCKVGIITSKQGAVINDFLNNLGGYGFKIKMADSRVEGQEALKDLLSSLKTLKKQKLDVLVVMRGGGSLESFLAFNNEVLVRELARFPVPTIVAIGHDKDVPLLALAADRMVSTPTAAANLLNQSWQKLEWEIKEKEASVFSFLSSFFEKFRLLEYRVKEGLLRIIESEISELKTKMDRFQSVVLSNDPKRNLALGYSIARKSGKIIRSIRNIEINDMIDLEVGDGIINSKVYERKKSEPKS